MSPKKSRSTKKRRSPKHKRQQGNRGGKSLANASTSSAPTEEVVEAYPSFMEETVAPGFEGTIQELSRLNWSALTSDEMEYDGMVVWNDEEDMSEYDTDETCCSFTDIDEYSAYQQDQSGVARQPEYPLGTIYETDVEHENTKRSSDPNSYVSSCEVFGTGLLLENNCSVKPDSGSNKGLEIDIGCLEDAERKSCLANTGIGIPNEKTASGGTEEHGTDQQKHSRVNPYDDTNTFEESSVEIHWFAQLPLRPRPRTPSSPSSNSTLTAGLQNINSDYVAGLPVSTNGSLDVSEDPEETADDQWLLSTEDPCSTDNTIYIALPTGLSTPTTLEIPLSSNASDAEVESTEGEDLLVLSPPLDNQSPGDQENAVVTGSIASDPQKRHEEPDLFEQVAAARLIEEVLEDNFEGDSISSFSEGIGPPFTFLPQNSSTEQPALHIPSRCKGPPYALNAALNRTIDEDLRRLYMNVISFNRLRESIYPKGLDLQTIRLLDNLAAGDEKDLEFLMLRIYQKKLELARKCLRKKIENQKTMDVACGKSVDRVDEQPSCSQRPQQPEICTKDELANTSDGIMVL